MAPLNIQDLSLNDSIPHHPSNRKKRKASIVYRVYTIDNSLSLKLRGGLLYHQMKRNKGQWESGMMLDSIDAVVRLKPCMQESNDALNNARLAEKTDNDSFPAVILQRTV